MKKILLLFFVTTFSWLCAVAQETSQPKKRYYVDENQKLHWQGDLPVYIFISDNPNGTGAVRMKSKKTTEYADPMYLDAEGLNYLRSRYAVDKETKKPVIPETEILYEIYKDSRPPVTTVSFDNAAIYKTAETTYYGPGLNVSSSAKDVISGVETTFISVNAQPFKVYAQPFVPSEDRSYTLGFYTTDNVGNAEASKQYSFIFDTHTPLSSLTTVGDGVGNVHSARTKVEITSDDQLAGVKAIYYSVDGGSKRKYTGKLSLTGLKDGEHSISYFAEDNVLNAEALKTYKFYLDTEPPLVKAEIIGDEYEGTGNVFVSTRSKVQLTASDNKSGVQKIIYSIDGGPEQEYSGPFNMLADGDIKSLKFYATDKVNNNVGGDINEKSFSTNFNMDASGPDLNFEYVGPKYATRDTIFITKDTKVNLMATDQNSGVKEIGYTVNNGELKSFSEPAAFEKEGVYTVNFTSKDEVSNENSDSFFFVVDNTGPVIKEVMSMQPIGSITLEDQPAPIPVYAKGAKLYLAATDGRIDTKGITFQIDGGEDLPYSRPYKFRTPGMVTYQVKATDNLGNSTVSDAVTLFIK